MSEDVLQNAATLHVAADQPEILTSKQYKEQKRKRVPVEGKRAALENNLAESERHVSSGEKARLNACHLLVTEMEHRISNAPPDGDIVLRDEVTEDAPLHKHFKSVIQVDEGATLRELEKEIAQKNPNLTLPTIRSRARAEHKRREKTASRLQWTNNAPDSALIPLLRSDQSPEMQSLLKKYEKEYAILNAKSKDEETQQSAFNEMRNRLFRHMKKQRKRAIREATALIAKADESVIKEPKTAAESAAEAATVADCDDDDNDKELPNLDYKLTDRTLLSLPQTLQTSGEKTESGLVVGKNSLGEVIEPNMFPMNAFAVMFSAEKSKSEQMMASDLTRYVHNFHTETVNNFFKMLDSAPSDACLTAKGERPSGSLAHDIRLLREENGFNVSAVSSERMLKYQELWFRTNTPVPADTERALALRVVQIDRSKAYDVMRSLGMAERDIKSAMLNGETADHSAFMRAVFASMATAAFIAAEEQAEVETTLAKRVAVDLKKLNKEAQRSSTTTTGSRGLEALGMQINSIPALTLKTLGVSIEVVDRQYVQDSMRPPMLPGERPCIRGEECLCMTMAASYPLISSPEGKGCGFIAKEFLLPSQLSTYKAHGKLPEYRFMCVICERCFVTAAVFHNVQNNLQPQMPLQRFSVPIGGDNGYRPHQILEPSACSVRLTGIVAPFPAFTPQNLVYSKFNVDGRSLNCIIESQTDFRMGSACTPRS